MSRRTHIGLAPINPVQRGDMSDMQLVPGRDAMLFADKKEAEFDRRHLDRFHFGDLDATRPHLQLQLEKQQKNIPSKAFRPLSLKAREDLADRNLDNHHVVVGDSEFGQRLDEYVLAKFPHLSRPAIKRLVEDGSIYRYRFNGKRRYARMTDRLERGELVVLPKSAASPEALANDMPHLIMNEDGTRKERKHVSLSGAVREEALKWVLFKNKHVIVLNKPSGIPMTGGVGVRLNVQDMLPCWKFTNPHTPLLVHRLDQDTSGVVVIARHPDAQKMLGRMFVRRTVPTSVYWGFLVGKPKAAYGRIRMHLEVSKDSGSTHIVARAAPTENSRAAIAEYVVNASALEYGSFVSFYPLTNRTHQLRVMAAHALRCPVLGDAKFGGEAAFPQSLRTFWDPEDKGIPLHLHHRKIQLPYKNSIGEFETVTAPLPDHLEKTFKKLGWPTEVDDPLIPG